ncbi:MAG: LamG-like jellyroll fold domain-containing protein [Lewinella sp.]
MRILLSLVLTLSVISVFAQHNGLIAYYPFEGNGNDLSGNGNDGVAFGDLKYENGIVGKAAAFDGKTTFFEILPKEKLPALGDFTITTWVLLKDYPMDNADHRGYIRSYLFNGHAGHRLSREYYKQGFSMLLDYTAAGKEEFHNLVFPFSGSGRGMAEQSIACQVKGFWRCVTFVRSGQEITTYVDGEKLKNAFVSFNRYVSDRPLNMNHHWYIGTYSGNNQNYYREKSKMTYNFKGLLDEMRIFNRALTADEVRSLCNIYAR